MHIFWIAALVLYSVPALAGDGIEFVLRGAAADKPQPGLIITYSDMDTFHGGIAIELHGDGRVLRWDSDGMRSNFLAFQNEGHVEASRLAPLLKMLVDLEAWRQLTTDRHAVPDESRASIVVTEGTERSHVWETYNDMPSNNRIIQVRQQLEGFISKGTKPCILPGRSSSIVPLPETCKGPT